VSNITPGAPSGSGGRRSSATAGIRNFAAIAFDYTVDGKHHTGTRVSVGADTGNTSVAETLARYPMGKSGRFLRSAVRPLSVLGAACQKRVRVHV
jgi:hypothetical protein